MKLRSADNLAPIWDLLYDMIPDNANVLDIGCGNGKLLLKIAQKLQMGLGIDESPRLIRSANEQARKFTHLSFQCKQIQEDFTVPTGIDCIIGSMFFHVISPDLSLSLLNKVKISADKLFVVALAKPTTSTDKWILWLDQRFSGHYHNFRSYQHLGYMDRILTLAQLPFSVSPTPIPFIKIYTVNL
ncbi:class I SAM-dependent methyltransferase [Echinicola soli]|uniref:Class I SAM-dependent methyltransferase n=1 Tax=Echinicola soli TaxID=2591634 RepID=A0A514CLT9_9BACT|nr:class I SAM-dependent methyltransferase [Echinicola soli]QDH80707.1 class I SAM-dependent methyltransferase [Echinicola soli]